MNNAESFRLTPSAAESAFGELPAQRRAAHPMGHPEPSAVENRGPSSTGQAPELDPALCLSRAVASGELAGLQRELSIETLREGRVSATATTVSLLQCGSTSGPSLGLPLDILGPLALQIRATQLLSRSAQESKGGAADSSTGIVVIADGLHHLAIPGQMNDQQRKGFCRMAAARFTMVEKLRSMGAPLEPVLAQDLIATPEFRAVVSRLEGVGYHRTAHPWAFYTAALTEAAHLIYCGSLRIGWSGFSDLADYALTARGLSASPERLRAGGGSPAGLGLSNGAGRFVPGCSLPSHQMLNQLHPESIPTLYHSPGRIVLEPAMQRAALLGDRAAPDVITYIEHHGKVLARNGVPELGRLALHGADLRQKIEDAFPQLMPTMATADLVPQLERLQYYWGITRNLMAALPALCNSAAQPLAGLGLTNRVLRELHATASHDRTVSTRGFRAITQQIRAAEFAQQNLRSQVVRAVLHEASQRLRVETHLQDAAAPTAPGGARKRRGFESLLTPFTNDASTREVA